jgi:hypothetical protein
MKCCRTRVVGFLSFPPPPPPIIFVRSMSDSIEVTDSITAEIIAGLLTPLQIMGADTVGWWRADLGVTLNGGNVASWLDQGPDAHVLAQASVPAQPVFNATGGPNARPSILFNGIGQWLRNSTVNRPAPATQRTLVWAVFRQVTWNNTSHICGFGTDANILRTDQRTVSPRIGQLNGVSGNTNDSLPVNTYGRMESGFAGTTASYLKLIGTTSTGLSGGNSDPAAGFSLAASGNQANRSNIEVCEFAIFNVFPTAGQQAQLDSYVTDRYGPGLV